MTRHSFRKTMITGAGALLALGLGACASSPGSGGMTYGQESSFHTPQGETGSPHSHGSSMTSSTGSTGAMGASRASVSRNPATGFGQENSQHAPQGETGSPHPH